MSFHLRYILIFCILACSTFSIGQSTLKGMVVDSLSQPLVSATVVLIQPSDSVMVSFALTGRDGGFTLRNINPGTYDLQITYLGYGSFSQVIDVSNSIKEKNLGVIFLSEKNTMLEQVVVKAEHVPIAITNDTVVYNAAAFKVGPNDDVEALLKQLPGVTVNRDGSIKAQGEDIGKVLVDGKEFFGNDPTIATKNLPADIVDKVQVFDKKSELAEFTGVDDGNDEKTINLSLKEDKKNGVFGKIEGGVGRDDPKSEFDDWRYKGRASVHRFDNKTQFSVLGLVNNNNDPGFSFQDYINFMGGMGAFMRGDGAGFNLSQNAIGIPLGDNRNPGITSTTAGGVNFNLAPNKKWDWQSSYFINRIENSLIEKVQSQNLTPDFYYDKNENNDALSVGWNHRFNSTLKFDADSSLQFRWVNRLGLNQQDVSSMSHSSSSVRGELINQAESLLTQEGDQMDWSSDLTLRKKFQKVGRLISGDFQFEIDKNRPTERINNQLSFYESGQLIEESNIFQDQFGRRDGTDYSIGLGYTEPLSNNYFLRIGFRHGHKLDKNNRRFFDINPNNPSELNENSALSNVYQKEFGYQRLGASLRYVSQKLKAGIGLDFQNSQLLSRNETDDSSTDNRYGYWLPSLNLNYDIRTGRSVEFHYNSYVNEPALDQLQPVLRNANPVYIYNGNPDLDPEWVHEMRLNYMLFDEFSFTDFFVGLRSRLAKNRIVNAIEVDSTFRQMVKPENTDYGLNADLFFNFGTPLRFMKSKVSVESSVGYDKGFLSLNGIENGTERWYNSHTLILENRNKKVWDVAIGATVRVNHVNFSKTQEYNQVYIQQSFFMDGSVELPHNWSISSQLDYRKYSSEAFANSDALLLASLKVSKDFLESKRANISVAVFDLFNQNTGISRSNNLNLIQETRSNVLGRYVMLTLSYRLSKFGNDGEGDIDINISG